MSAALQRLLQQPGSVKYADKILKIDFSNAVDRRVVAEWCMKNNVEMVEAFKLVTRVSNEASNFVETSAFRIAMPWLQAKECDIKVPYVPFIAILERFDYNDSGVLFEDYDDRLIAHVVCDGFSLTNRQITDAAQLVPFMPKYENTIIEQVLLRFLKQFGKVNFEPIFFTAKYDEKVYNYLYKLEDRMKAAKTYRLAYQARLLGDPECSSYIMPDVDIERIQVRAWKQIPELIRRFKKEEIKVPALHIDVLTMNAETDAAAAIAYAYKEGDVEIMIENLAGEASKICPSPCKCKHSNYAAEIAYSIVAQQRYAADILLKQLDPQHGVDVSHVTAFANLLSKEVKELQPMKTDISDLVAALNVN